MKFVSKLRTVVRNTLLSICFFFLIPSCVSFVEKESCKDEKKDEGSLVVNLTESTHIIRTLITQNKLSDILEEHDPKKLSLLVDNVSPAKMAFESEVLSTTVPFVVVYYFKKNEESKRFIEQLEKLAITYNYQVKFATVDIEQLFSLVQDAEVEKVPTLLFIKNREIIDRLDSDVTIGTLEKKLGSVLMNF